MQYTIYGVFTINEKNIPMKPKIFGSEEERDNYINYNMLYSYRIFEYECDFDVFYLDTH